MLTDEQIEAIADYIEDQYHDVERQYYGYIAEQLHDIGITNQLDFYRVISQIMANEGKIRRALDNKTKLMVATLLEIIAQAGKSSYNDTEIYYKSKGLDFQPIVNNIGVKSTIDASARNLLNLIGQTTTHTNISNTYNSAIQGAISAIQGGADYTQTISKTIKKLSSDGLRVQYPSGYTQRLDSAVRRNILDGVHYTNQQIRNETGRQFGADGIEISAHSACAEDHQPYQGNQYTNNQFNDIQNNLERPFGKFNCRHVMFPIIMGISSPAYSASDLKQLQIDNENGIMYQGKHYTLYEATQEMRKMELAIRYAEDVEYMANASGQIELAQQMRSKQYSYSIPNIRKHYNDFAKVSGIRTRTQRIAQARSRLIS